MPSLPQGHRENLCRGEREGVFPSLHTILYVNHHAHAKSMDAGTLHKYMMMQCYM